MRKPKGQGAGELKQLLFCIQPYIYLLGHVTSSIINTISKHHDKLIVFYTGCKYDLTAVVEHSYLWG